MSYRETSFDPMASPRYGRPLRPYNKVQWIGAAITVAGIAVILAAFVSRLGLFALDTSDWLPMATTFCALGTALVSSRREVLSTETRTPSRRLLIVIAIGLVAFAIGLTAALYFKGA